MANWKKIAAQQGYRCVLTVGQAILGADRVKMLDARFRFGRRIDLRHPRTLADKVSWLSLHGMGPLEIRCTDKWEAREYVASKGLAEILIPVCGPVMTRVEELDFDRLPETFVLKATHGCGMNLVCWDKSQLDPAACRREAARWLRTTYGRYSMEPHYRSIPHRLYCEACIGGPEGLTDYKIHCLNGKPSFVLVCSQREGTGVTMDIYDTKWNWLDAVRPYRGHVPGKGGIPKPRNLERMLEIARILSAEFDFVRVDLYETDGHVYFGELTFTPANGVLPSYRPELLERAGKALRLRALEEKEA